MARKKKVDKETQQVLDKNQALFELVNHSSWKQARQIIADKILDLQNAFNIDDRDTAQMLADLRARKIATTLLFDFLREIEGSAYEAVQDKKQLKSYIVNLE